MKIIVDSGSTKATWWLAAASDSAIRITTEGINPVRDDEARIRHIIVAASQGMPRQVLTDTTAIHFYGAGCIAPYSDIVAQVLREVFGTQAAITVDSDLLGAARALCGHQSGIACILGTGANSCLYDGERIVANTPALGWILGDEGSGAVLGRTLVADVLKGQLPKPLCEAFLQRFELTAAKVIDAVYRQPIPNRFLASLVPFLAEYRSEPAIHALLTHSFSSFFRRNVAAYNQRELSVGFVGGIAHQFEDELRQVAEAEGYKIGLILRDPIEAMAQFHVA